ncbi:MAG: hypothetical protein C4527_27715 [Candidatus Omnitrophota bacterium]|jgi:hypothetical protein|nr:MAG: hypothetical protein C4527_27715 [Candidatus Omnitrophota bacterium]
MKELILLLVMSILAMLFIVLIITGMETTEPETQQYFGEHARETKERFDLFVSEILLKGKVERLSEFVSGDCRIYTDSEQKESLVGRESLRTKLLELFTSIPNYTMVMNEFMAYDDRITFYWPGSERAQEISSQKNKIDNTNIFGYGIICFENGKISKCLISKFTTSGFQDGDRLL